MNQDSSREQSSFLGRSQMRSELCVGGRTAVAPRAAGGSHTHAGVLTSAATTYPSCVYNAERHPERNSAPHPAGVRGGCILAISDTATGLSWLIWATQTQTHRWAISPLHTMPSCSPNWTESHCDSCLEMLPHRHRACKMWRNINQRGKREDLTTEERNPNTV